MPGNVSADTAKLESIKNALQQFGVDMHSCIQVIINYIIDKRADAEKVMRSKEKLHLRHEEERRQQELSADESEREAIKAENQRLYHEEVNELSEIRSLFHRFISLSDELITHLRKLNGETSITIDKGASMLAKCIEALEGYLAVQLPQSTVSGHASQNSIMTNRHGVSSLNRLKTDGKTWAFQLNESQREAIRDYTKELPRYYENINATLRGLVRSFDPGNRERSDLIHAALVQAKMPCDFTVYRGCSYDAIGNDLLRMSDEQIVGQVYFDRGYVSTSMSKGRAFGGDLLLKINLPQGCHAVNIESLSEAGSYEEEVLIDRDQLFQIIGYYSDNDGRRIIEVNLIN